MKCIFGSENIHALIGDGAAVNGNACNALIPFLPICAVSQFACSIQWTSLVVDWEEVVRKQNILFKCGQFLFHMVVHTTKLKCKDLTNKIPKRISQVRWFTFWEVASQILDYCSSVLQIVNNFEEFGEETCDGLRHILAKIINLHSDYS